MSQIPSALRASFSYDRTLFEDRKHNEQFGQTKLEMPVLALGCEFGYGQGAKATMEQVATNVSSAIIESSGHYPAEEQPEQLASVLLDFFA